MDANWFGVLTAIIGFFGVSVTAWLGHKNASGKTKIDEINTVVSTLKGEVERLTNDNKEIRGELAKLKDELDTKNELIATLKEEKRILELENCDLKNQIAAHKQYLKEKDALIKDLEGK